MSQIQTPTTPDEITSTDVPDQEEPQFRDFLRFATAEIQASLQQGAELQQEINARKVQINEAIFQLLKAA